jgi:hypothetical protein
VVDGGLTGDGFERAVHADEWLRAARHSTGSDQRFYAIVADVTGAPMEMVDAAGKVASGWEENAAFIAMARGAVPGLVAEIRRRAPAGEDEPT